MPTAATSDARDLGAVGRAFHLAETAIYLALGVLLAVGAGILLVATGHQIVTTVGGGAVPAMKEVLDTLLLVFIFVELLAAVSETVRERKLVAEPFLLVGIIASIKEVVVFAIDAKDAVGKDVETFRSSMIGVGTMSLLLLVVSVALLLVRRKEREPAEGDR